MVLNDFIYFIITNIIRLIFIIMALFQELFESFIPLKSLEIYVIIIFQRKTSTNDILFDQCDKITKLIKFVSECKKS